MEQSNKAAGSGLNVRLSAASRPWPFEEHAKPAMYLGVSKSQTSTNTVVGTGDVGKPLHGAALKLSGPVDIERTFDVHSDVVASLVDSGASGQYFDDAILP